MVDMKTKWSGTLLMVAQPAEEAGPGASGAEAMLNDGLYTRFPKPDYILGLHQTPALVTGKVGFISGYSNAVTGAGEIVMRGVAAHPARRTPRGARAFAGRRGRPCVRHRLVRPDASTRVRGRHQDRVERRGASSHGGAGAAAREAVRDASGGAGALPEGVRPRGGGRCGITGGCARCRPRGREVSPERARAGAWRWIRAPMRSASRRCPN